MGGTEHDNPDDPFAFMYRADTPVVVAEQPCEHDAYEPSPGHVIDGRWRLERLIGRGGFGVVFAARAIEDPDVPLAIKLVAPDRADDGPWRERFAQEAAVAVNIEHPNVVDVHAWGLDEHDVHYLVMELLDGDSLHARIVERSPLPWSEIARVAVALGAALGAVHRTNIVHRDVKPDNVLVVDADDTQATIKLLDFGLCKSPTALTASMEQIGTAPYMPPEMFRHGAGTLDASADIYGMAACVYEATAGHAAFANPDWFAMIRQICDGPGPTSVAQRRPGSSEALAALLDQGLSRERERRPTDAAQYGLALAAAIDGCD